MSRKPPQPGESPDGDGFGHTVSGDFERRAPRPAPRRGPPGDWGPVTLVARVSGASRLGEKLGKAEAGHFLKRCLKRLEQACSGHHGQLVRQGTDDLIAVFDAPAAALLAACRMQKSVAALPPVSGVQPAVRIAFDRIAVDSEPLPLGEMVDAVLTLSRQARQEQIVTRCALAELLPVKLHHVVHRRQRPEDRDGDDAVCEIRWRDLGDVAADVESAPVAKTGAPRARLRLRYRDQQLELDSRMLPLLIGRGSHCGIVVIDPRGSRQHARIEWRNNRYVLIDTSLNGTFVGVDGMARLLLKRDEAVLHGSGVILCGHNEGKPDEEVITFAVTD